MQKSGWNSKHAECKKLYIKEHIYYTKEQQHLHDVVKQAKLIYGEKIEYWLALEG